MLPDTSDDEKMAHIGRMTVLRKARRETGQRLRDKVVALLNDMDGQSRSWDVSGIVSMVEQIEAINKAIDDIN